MEHEQSHNRKQAFKASDDDATLDIVRLLIETENRRAEERPDSAAKASYLEQPSQQATPTEPPQLEASAPKRRPLGRRKAKVEDLVVKLEPTEQPQPQEDLRHEPLPPAEDLRPRKLGLAAPRLRLPKFALPALPTFKKRMAGAEKLDSQPSIQEPPERRKFWTTRVKLIALMAFCLVVFLKPWLIPLIMFVVVWLALIIFLLFGSARVSDLLGRVWGYYQAKRPEGARRTLTALQNAADRLDGILARLPDRWVDGIYSPDLGRSERAIGPEEEYVLNDDPFDRLSMRHGPAE